METNELIREQIFEIIKNQLENNDPPEVKIIYDQLITAGHNDFETRQMIGQCISVELFEIIKNGKSFNISRYLKNLKNLPKEPFE